MDGGFGGDAAAPSAKSAPPERDAGLGRRGRRPRPSRRCSTASSGDLNPLHADPAVAEKAAKVIEGKPILHGLCTYGYVGRAILATACGERPGAAEDLLRALQQAVWPGETIVTEGWREDGRVIVRAATKERPDELRVHQRLRGARLSPRHEEIP